MVRSFMSKIRHEHSLRINIKYSCVITLKEDNPRPPTKTVCACPQISQAVEIAEKRKLALLVLDMAQYLA
jgi:hypothetical protein